MLKFCDERSKRVAGMQADGVDGVVRVMVMFFSVVVIGRGEGGIHVGCVDDGCKWCVVVVITMTLIRSLHMLPC